MKNKKVVVDYFARSRVSFGFFIATGALLFLRPSEPALVLIGLIVSLIGLLIRSWAAGNIRKSKELATEGPYSVVRHPLYLGSILMALGFSVALSCPDRPIITISFWILLGLYFCTCYPATIINEERALHEKFRERWMNYRESVPAFLPINFRTWALFGHTFSLKQYLKNREYQAVAGWAGAAILLFILLPSEKGQIENPTNGRAEMISVTSRPSAKSVISVAATSQKPEVNARQLVELPHPSKPSNSMAPDQGKEAQAPHVREEEKQLASIPIDLNDDLLNEKSHSALLSPWFGLAFTGTSALMLMDNQSRAGIQKFFGQRSGQEVAQHGRPAGKYGELTSGLGMAGGFYATGLLSNSAKAKRIGVVGAQALLVNSLLTEAIGNSLNRSSPSNGDADDFSQSEESRSFPSRQTSNAFALASVVAEESNSFWIDSLSYGLAGIVGISRLSDDKHWASDVAVGAVIGIGVGKTVSRLERRKGWSKRLYTDGKSVKYEQKF